MRKTNRLMVPILKVASYITEKYRLDYESCIDEMKLHKLLYFLQREWLIEFDKPLFSDDLVAWDYGPVSPLVRKVFKHPNQTFPSPVVFQTEEQEVFDRVWATYSAKESWSLSTLSHGEISWRNARDRKANGGSDKLTISDIRMDALKIQRRRRALQASESIICSRPE